MGGFTPMIWTLLVVGTAWTPALVTWRGAFALFGLIGVAWCAAFAWFFRDHPRDHPRVNAAEQIEIERGRDTGKASHAGLPIRSMLGSANLWLICLMYFCMVYGWYFHVTYLPSYLQDRFDLDPRSMIGALYKGAPLWIGAFSCLAGGILVDWLIRRTGNRQRARRLVGMTAEGLCALGWIAAIFAPNVHTLHSGDFARRAVQRYDLGLRLGHVPGYRRALHGGDGGLHEHRRRDRRRRRGVGDRHDYRAFACRACVRAASRRRTASGKRKTCGDHGRIRLQLYELRRRLLHCRPVLAIHRFRETHCSCSAARDKIMTRQIVRPDKLDLESPGRRDYWVALEHDTLWGDHLIPLTVFVGPKARAGKGLVAFGANHGNEYEGPMALKRLMNEIRIEDVLGRIILIPVLNPAAFGAGTRDSTLDDGVNLNRAFVDGAGTTPALGGHHPSDCRVRATSHLAAGACGARSALRRARGAFWLVRQLSSDGRSRAIEGHAKKRPVGSARRS